ncbi:MAG: box helicase, partial [Rhizobacter sp.]|nr:box helicase [Rhizobacter sp.]
MTHEVNADPPEPQGSRIPALRLLCNLGWQFLGSHDRLQQCGGTRQVLLIPRLIEVLQTRRFEYKGEWVPLSPSGIDQIVRELSALDLAHGLLRANERLYNKLLLGIAITEFMPDGKRHQPTIAVIDWSEQGTTTNRFDVAEGLEVLSAQGTHSLISDIVCYVNGIPLAMIEAQRPGTASARKATGKATGKATVEEGISRHLRNQRHDQAPHLFAYAQLLLAIGHGEARYGTTGTAAKFWARWREEEFSDAQMSAWKNLSLDAGTHAALFTNKPTAARKYFER